MPYSAAAKNAMLDHLGTLITHVSLHTGFPATHANEVAGGAYARLPVAFAAAAGGTKDSTGDPRTFEVPAGVTVSAIGFRNSLAGTAEPFADSNVTDEVFAAAGQYVLDDADLDLNAV